MDWLNQLLNSLFGGNPLLVMLAGVVIPILLQRLGIKVPFAPPATNPNGPAPAPSPTGRPLLDLLLSLLRGGGGAAKAGPASLAEVLAHLPPAELVALRRVVGEKIDEHRAALAPEPTRPTL